MEFTDHEENEPKQHYAVNVLIISVLHFYSKQLTFRLYILTYKCKKTIITKHNEHIASQCR